MIDSELTPSQVLTHDDLDNGSLVLVVRGTGDVSLWSTLDPATTARVLREAADRVEA